MSKIKKQNKEPVSWQAIGIQKVLSIYLTNDLIKRSTLLIQKNINAIKTKDENKLNKLIDDPLLEIGSLVTRHLQNLWNISFRLGQVDSNLELIGSKNRYINQRLKSNKSKNVRINNGNSKNKNFNKVDLFTKFRSEATYLINNSLTDLITFVKRERIEQTDVTDNPADSRYANLVMQPASLTNTNSTARKYITAYGTRYADLYLKRQTLNDLAQNNISPDYISSRKFAGVYANKRQLEIARNFTEQYKSAIKSNITNYIKSGLEIKRDKDLIEILSGERIANLEDPMYGLNQQARDSDTYREPYKTNALSDGSVQISNGQYSMAVRSVHGRVERIAKTELAVAYNLGSMDAFVSNGVRAFKWQTRVVGGNPCVCCRSLDFYYGVEPHVNKLYTITDVGFSYNPNTNFRNIRTDRVAPSGLGNDFTPPVHPYCFCRLVPLTPRDEDYLSDKDKAILNNLKKDPNAWLKILAGSGIAVGAGISGVNAAGKVKATLEEEYKAAELRNQEAKIQQAKKYENIFKAGLIGASVFTAGLGFYSLLKSKAANLSNVNKVESLKKEAANLESTITDTANTVLDQVNNIVSVNPAIGKTIEEKPIEKLSKEQARAKMQKLTQAYNEAYTKQWSKLTKGTNAAVSKEFARIERTIEAIRLEVMLASQNQMTGMFGDSLEITKRTLQQRILQVQAQLQGLEASVKTFNNKIVLTVEQIQTLSQEYGVKIPESVVRNHENKYKISLDNVLSNISNKKQELENMIAFLNKTKGTNIPQFFDM